MKQNDTKTARFLLTTLLVGIGLVWNGCFVFEAKATTTQTTSGDYTVLAPLPCIEGGGITCDKGNGSLQETVSFKTYVQYTINLLIGLSAVVAVVMIVWGGVEYMYTASFTGKKEGMDKVTHAIYGLVLILTSYIILRTIDPRLVEIPNTIVPRIIIQSWLQQDFNAELTKRVMKDASEATMQNIEIAKKIDGIRAEKVDNSTKISEIERQINELKQKNPVDTEKIKQLEIEQKKLGDKNNDLEIQKQLDTARIYFNGVYVKALTETTSSEANGKLTTQEKLAKFAEAQKLLEMNRKEFESRLLALGYPVKSPLNNIAELTAGEIELAKIQAIMDDATVAVTSGVVGKAGVKHILMVDFSGKDRNLTPADAKKVIESQLAKVVAMKNNINNESIRNELAVKIDALKVAIDSNEKFK